MLLRLLRLVVLCAGGGRADHTTHSTAAVAAAICSDGVGGARAARTTRVAPATFAESGCVARTTRTDSFVIAHTATTTAGQPRGRAVRRSLRGTSYPTLHALLVRCRSGRAAAAAAIAAAAAVLVPCPRLRQRPQQSAQLARNVRHQCFRQRTVKHAGERRRRQQHAQG
eukprot:215993-Chlamydomonas_euryale.AAC.1